MSPDLALWLSSPDTAIQNLIHAAILEGEAIGDWRTTNLPGISVTVQQMLDSLRRMTNSETLSKVQFKEDPSINRIVSTWPGAIDNTRALSLGFRVDKNFDDFIIQYRENSRRNI